MTTEGVRRRRVVIVGGVAAGMSAATRLRRNDEHLDIVVLERGDHVSFANCGLPYHIGGVIQDRGQLLLQTPESLHQRFAIDVRVGHEVTSIDLTGQTVSVRRRLGGSQSVEPYDALVLATGAVPVIPSLPGIGRARTLRDLADTDRIIADLDGGHGPSPRTAAILGGGFIGLELAENLTRRGLSVTVIELAEQVLAPLDPEMVQPVAEHLRQHGVDVQLGLGAVRIESDSVVLSDGRTVPADLVVSAVGVAPESGIARQAGLQIGERGGVVVDELQRTSDPNVYAVGDVAQKRDALSGGPTLVPLAQTANRHGRLVADVICGRRVSSLPTLGTAVVGVFDLTVASTGWNEKRLQAAGRHYRAIHTHPFSHAGYYPGAEQMALKLLVDADTDQILGAQGVGGEGVDKRIDVIATAMRGGLRGSDLADLELAYAPQFGSAKDPVTMLGMIADNLSAEVVRTVQWHEVEDLQAAGATLIDVRTAQEVAQEPVPDALKLPLDELRARHHELPSGSLLVLCAVGLRGHTATRLLSQLGHDVANLDGGYRTWAAGVGVRRTADERTPVKVGRIAP